MGKSTCRHKAWWTRRQDLGKAPGNPCAARKKELSGNLTIFRCFFFFFLVVVGGYYRATGIKNVAHNFLISKWNYLYHTDSNQA